MLFSGYTHQKAVQKSTAFFILGEISCQHFRLISEGTKGWRKDRNTYQGGGSILKRRMKIMVLTVLCLALICCTTAAGAEVGLRAWVGYDGAVLSGRWYPLFMEVTAEDEPVSGVLSVDVAVNYGVYDRFDLPVSVPAGESRTFRLPIFPTYRQNVFEVKLDEAVSATAHAAYTVPENALVIGLLGEDTEELQDALSEMEILDVQGNREIIAPIALDNETFAQEMREMWAFDALVTLDGAEKKLSKAYRTLLSEWEHEGGILLCRSSASWTEPQAAAQQVMNDIQAAQKAGKRVSHNEDSFFYGGALTNTMPPSPQGNLIPVAAALLVYVLLAGVGAYLLMKRLDRSKALWYVIPMLAVVCCGVLALMSAGMKLNQPMSSSVHVVYYDETGRMQAGETASLTYAGQERRTIAAEGGVPVERSQYRYYNESDRGESQTMRDRITLGEAPSVELEGGADWLVRDLVIDSTAAPAGTMTAMAHMEEDGLHIQVKNDTDAQIENAVVLTGMGYARLGDLAPGMSAEVLLRRTVTLPAVHRDAIVIDEGQMMPFGGYSYRMMHLAVYPEYIKDATWTTESLSKEERIARRMAEEVLRIGLSIERTEDFICTVIGETPHIACQTLTIDGEAITRRAEKSVVACHAAFDPVSPSGYLYYPEGSFKAHEAALEASGVPVLGKEMDSMYIYQKNEVLLGYALSGIAPSEVREIRFVTNNGISEDGSLNPVVVQAYDAANGAWIPLEETECMIRVEGDLARRIVSESGEICLRVKGESMADYGMRVPNVIVEGQRNAEAAQDSGELTAQPLDTVPDEATPGEPQEDNVEKGGVQA